MKKILFSVFIITILLSFFLFLDIKNNEITGALNELGTENVFMIHIKQDVDGLDRQDTIEKMQKVIKEYNGSITRKIYIDSSSRTTDIIQYVYVKDPIDYFKSISIQGDFLKKYDDSSSYLTSANSNDSNEVGTIEVLKKDSVYEIRTLEALVNSKKSLSGIYYINLESQEDSESFINSLADSIGVEVTEEYSHTSNMIWFPILEILPIIFLYFLAVIIVLYTIFYRFKEIGVKKLMGYDDDAIRFELIKEIVKVFSLAFICSYGIIAIFYYFNQSQLLLITVLTSLVIVVILFLITLLIMFIPLLFLGKITIVHVLKNKKPTKLINSINSIFKIIFTLIFVVLFIFISKNCISLYYFYGENYPKWEMTKKYAYVPLRYMNQDKDLNSFLWETEQMKRMYWYTNNLGSVEIYIPFEIQNSEIKKNSINQLSEVEAQGGVGSEYARIAKLKLQHNCIVVNNNYLKTNPIYDVNGDVVQVDENANVLLVLIPERLKELESEIIKAYEYPYNNGLFTMNPSEIHNYLPDLFDEGNPVIQTKIVKDKQKYFTYNFEMFKESNNYILDPIVSVNNNKIEFVGDISNNRGYYIKVDDPADPFATIREEVEGLGLTAYFQDAYSLYDGVSERVYAAQDALKKQIIIAVIVFVVLTLLIVYMTIIYIEKLKISNAIKILNGYSFMARHKKYFLIILVPYIALLPLMFLIGENLIEKSTFIAMIFSMIVIEIGITIVTIVIAEKRNLKDILKGN